MSATIWGLIIMSELYKQDGSARASKFMLSLAGISVLLEIIGLFV